MESDTVVHNGLCIGTTVMHGAGPAVSNNSILHYEVTQLYVVDRLTLSTELFLYSATSGL